MALRKIQRIYLLHSRDEEINLESKVVHLSWNIFRAAKLLD